MICPYCDSRNVTQDRVYVCLDCLRMWMGTNPAPKKGTP